MSSIRFYGVQNSEVNAIKVIKMKKSNFFEYLFDPENSLIIFIWAIGITYGVIPLFISIFRENSESFGFLSAITMVSIMALWVGGKINIFDSRFFKHSLRLSLSPRKFVLFTFGVFFIFLIVTFLTAPSIPIWSALMGADSNELSSQRGAFLKGREGVEIILLYISTILVNTIVPYSIIVLFVRKSKLRFVATFLFFVFCISFMQKSLFLNCIFPIFAFLSINRRLHRKFITFFLGLIAALLLVTTALSLRGESLDQNSGGDYFSATYSPNSALDYFLWRSIAVPIFTATDTLVVHEKNFQGENLWGATSSSISALFGIERINIERFVFEHQFGSWNEIANANSVFMIDAFVNFGWCGVIIFGVFVGQIFRWFRLSNDIAFKSLWPIFAFVLFSAPLIGMLLSNGFAYMLFHSLFIRVQKDAN
ncbi:hypothetical protein [Comamonas sp. lk]|uniref:hypothetical protein n=1 Tax=Comamonas sp. lk TaxID=2201272 RepID=UPI0013CE46CA|nr:hypothetical protein [Comamonas sp. lk]